MNSLVVIVFRVTLDGAEPIEPFERVWAHVPGLTTEVTFTGPGGERIIGRVTRVVWDEFGKAATVWIGDR